MNGYITIGNVAVGFMLGAVFTILCFKLSQVVRKEYEERTK